MIRLAIKLFSLSLPLLTLACQGTLAPIQGPIRGTTPLPYKTSDLFPGPIPGKHYMVSASHPQAAEAGKLILELGGSAIDAAIATQMVLSVVEPFDSGIGGSAFALYYDADSGKVISYDGLIKAPKSAQKDMFLTGQGKALPYGAASTLPQAIGLPGTLKLLFELHRKHGTRPWSTLFDPAISLAESGFTVTPLMAHLIRETPALRQDDMAKTLFYTADGKPFTAGQQMVNIPLAKTMRQIAEKGADYFYRQELAQQIRARVNADLAQKYHWRTSDLANYRVKKRQPICLSYRDKDICSAPPASSGGVTLLQIMALVEPYMLNRLSPNSPTAWHLIAEASRLAYADRRALQADPDFIKIPVKTLLSDAYLDKRRSLISSDKIIKTVLPGYPEKKTTRSPAQTNAGPENKGASTTHFSIVDPDGNALSMTSTLGRKFGNYRMVGGFFLNNQMADFNFGNKNGQQTHPNHVAPGKRPRSTMTPTFVFNKKDGQFDMALGSPGGARQISYLATRLIAMIDWNLSVRDALRLPHLVNRHTITEIESKTPLQNIIPALQALGHQTKLQQFHSGLHLVRRRGNYLVGGVDHREDGAAYGDQQSIIE